MRLYAPEMGCTHRNGLYVPAFEAVRTSSEAAPVLRYPTPMVLLRHVQKRLCTLKLLTFGWCGAVVTYGGTGLVQGYYHGCTTRGFTLPVLLTLGQNTIPEALRVVWP